MLSFSKLLALSRNSQRYSECHLLRRFVTSEAELLDLFQGAPVRKNEREFIPDKRHIPEEKPKVQQKNAKDVIIKCQRPEFNHLRNQKYDKLKPIPLASKGWYHPKSKGDFFSIHIYDQDYDVSNMFWEKDSRNFDSLELNDVLVEALKAIGYEKPTKIQAEGIPAVLSGKNTLIAAETGCGKTLAFLVPVLQQILHWKEKHTNRNPNTPLALILTPSRELAVQIGNIAKELCHRLPISYNVLTGGRIKQKMLNPEFRNIDLQVATLGAISKLTTTGIYNLAEVRHLIVDESDTMLDDSFSEHLLRFIRKIKIRYKPTSKFDSVGCQLTLVSATFPKNFEETLADFIEPSSFIRVTSKSLHKFLPHVPQTFYRLGSSEKPTKLLHIARNALANNQPTMIFSNRSPTCDWISLMLHENGIEALNLNGEMPLLVRMGKFEQFQRGEINVLSCTDIASRGLDTSNVKHIVNYDFPLYMADYIHRCGRTGRCGSPKDCHITNFVSGIREVELVNKIEMAVRTMEALPNVSGNITKIIRKRIKNNPGT